MLDKWYFLLGPGLSSGAMLVREGTWAISITLASKLKISGAMYSGEPHTVAASMAIRYINGRVMCDDNVAWHSSPKPFEVKCICLIFRVLVWFPSSPPPASISSFFPFTVFIASNRDLLLNSTGNGVLGIRTMSCSGKALAKPKSASFNTGSTEPRRIFEQNVTRVTRNNSFVAKGGNLY